MSDRAFDTAVRDWLDSGSDRTPPAAIDAVLLAVKTTPQERDRRIPRRITRMPSFLRYAAAAAIIAVVGVGALMYFGGGPGIGGPTPVPPTQAPTATPAPSAVPTVMPSPSGAPVSFTSPLYRYSVTVPAGWVVTAATIPWPEGAALSGSNWDLFAGPQADPADFDDVVVASQFVPEGMTAGDWLSRYAQQQAASGRDCKGASDAWYQAVVGGLDIRRVDLECQGIRLSDVAFVVENRGHAMSGNQQTIALFLNTFEHGEFFGIPLPTPASFQPG